MPGSRLAPAAPARREDHAKARAAPAIGRLAALLRRSWRRPLWFHALCLGLLIIAAAPFLHLSEAFTIDEGAYAVQVRDLDRGRWEFDYRGEPADPEGRWLPLYNPTRGARHSFAYVKQPSYPAALLIATRIAGDTVGLHLLAMLGALAVAAAAWLLAGEVDPRASRGAFWLAATGPVAVNAYVVWAHAPSSALAGFATLAGLRLGKRFETTWACVLLACVVAGVLLRAEGLLFAVALAVGLLLVGLRGRRWVVRAGIPAVCVAATGAAVMVDSWWRSTIVGSSYATQGLRGDDASPISAGGGGAAWWRWAGGRLEGAWNSLFRGSFGGRPGALFVGAALVLLGYAGWAARRRRPGWQRDVTLALGATTALYALRLGADAGEPITGLFGAWPLALLGLALMPKERWRVALPLVVVAGTFAVAVLATQYRIGGGREWGGRFFFPVLAPVAVLACLGLRHLAASWERPRVMVSGLLVLLALLPTLAGLSMLHTYRGQAKAIVDEVTSDTPSVVVTNVSGLPPFAWKTYPEVGWMAAPSTQFGEVTARLRAAGFRRVTVLGPNTMSASDLTSYPLVKDVTGPEARKRGWRLFLLSERA